MELLWSRSCENANGGLGDGGEGGVGAGTEGFGWN